MTFQPKQKVRIRRLVGAGFEPDWSERGVIQKPKGCQKTPSAEWFIVKFSHGGALCIHQSGLMADNA